MSSTPGYAKRYELDRVRGIDRTPVPAGPVRSHILRLMDAGLTPTAIARTADTSRKAVQDIANGRTTTCRRPIARRILRTTVPAAVAATRGSGEEVPAVGTIRRVQALLALGHTHETITLASGCSSSCRLTASNPPPRVTRAVADGIAQAFAALCMTPGPSARTRARAAASGYVPPLGWDDIDNDPTPPAPDVKVTVVEEAEWLARAGVNFKDAAHRLGYSNPDSLEHALYRADRGDLVSRLRRAA